MQVILIIGQKPCRYLIFTYIFLWVHLCIVVFFAFFRCFQRGSVYCASNSPTIVRRSTRILIQHLQQQSRKTFVYRNNNLKFNNFTVQPLRVFTMESTKWSDKGLAATQHFPGCFLNLTSLRNSIWWTLSLNTGVNFTLTEY